MVDAFLLKLTLQGCVITADALFTQPSIAQQIVVGGGYYILPVKENQALTFEAIFEEWFATSAPYDLPNQVAHQCEKRHGRLTCGI
jgi:predicted transposase YbfD/YdcC